MFHPIHITDRALPEALKIVSLVVSQSVKELAIISTYPHFQNYSTYAFGHWNSTQMRVERRISFLSNTEIRTATLCIVGIVQQVNFTKEIQFFRKWKRPTPKYKSKQFVFSLRW